MRVVAFCGPSKSGKTTTICALIRRLHERGRTVAAIKHTHHPINEERRGDTRRFAEAGASPVILAGEGEALIFEEQVRRIAYDNPSELLPFTPADVVLIEGFKDCKAWPHAASIDDALALIDKS